MNDIVFELDREVTTLVDTLDEHPVAQTLFDGTITARHYARYLEQTEHYVGVSEELLRGSGERLLATRKHRFLARLLLQKSRRRPVTTRGRAAIAGRSNSRTPARGRAWPCRRISSRTASR